MSELKPCPLCGDPGKEEISRDENGTLFWFVCSESRCAIGKRIGRINREDALREWNTRPIEDAITAERDAAKTKLSELWLDYELIIKERDEARRERDEAVELVRQVATGIYPPPVMMDRCQTFWKKLNEAKL